MFRIMYDVKVDDVLIFVTRYRTAAHVNAVVVPIDVHVKKWSSGLVPGSQRLPTIHVDAISSGLWWLSIRKPLPNQS